LYTLLLSQTALYKACYIHSSVQNGCLAIVVTYLGCLVVRGLFAADGWPSCCVPIVDRVRLVAACLAVTLLAVVPGLVRAFGRVEAEACEVVRGTGLDPTAVRPGGPSSPVSRARFARGTGREGPASGEGGRACVALRGPLPVVNFLLELSTARSGPDITAPDCTVAGVSSFGRNVGGEGRATRRWSFRRRGTACLEG
jgi:hypothetical protein